jgi:pyridoxine 5-phosphate synthase
MIRLGVNIDHVATVRQARGERYPDPVQAAVMAELGGADNITAHLREDRRHIQDRDVTLLRQTIQIPLNFEMAPTAEMIDIALKLKPHSITLVPEKRQERTTEGGLDLQGQQKVLKDAVARFADANILVSLFIEPDLKAVELSQKLGAGAVEFHTGSFCRQIDAAVTTKARLALVEPLKKAAKATRDAGMQAHFGHGLNYANANYLQLVADAEEANIGHAIVARALFVGLPAAVAEMKALLNDPSKKPFVE